MMCAQDCTKIEVRPNFRDCHIFCATTDYCQELANTVLPNVISSIVMIAELVVGFNPITLISLIARILELAQQFAHVRCGSL